MSQNISQEMRKTNATKPRTQSASQSNATLSNAALINGIGSNYLRIDDRAIHYGDGLFETILCRNNRLYYWQQHYRRLQASAQKLKIDCPDEQLLLHDITRLLSENAATTDQTSVLKIILSRGTGERGYQFTKNAVPNRIVLWSELSPGYSSLLSEQLVSGDLYVCQQQLSINENLAGLKHLNRLENVLARNEWTNHFSDSNYIDGLMLNADAYVIEGSMSNLFAVKNKQLFTPSLLRSGVNGVMRELVIDLADRAGLSLQVTDLTLDELYKMDELFITNSLIGLKSVTRLMDYSLPENTITHQIFNDILKTKDIYATTV